jgi:hypothetical protein
MSRINTFDIDGVINMGEFDGVYPGSNDVIITGRSFEEQPETEKMLARKGIKNKVYYNPIKFDDKTRETSGVHKAMIIKLLTSEGRDVCVHFEDDPIQSAVIKALVPSVHVVLLQHDLVNKENVRHDTYDE